MSEFKVGDRVVVLLDGERHSDYKRYKGTVKEVFNTCLMVLFDRGEKVSYNIRLFKKLKPKKKLLECWVNTYPSGNLYSYPTKEKADEQRFSERIDCVHMREVREKK